MGAQRSRVVALGAALVLGVAAGAWWFSPWGTAFRYERCSLLALKRIADARPEDRLAWRTLGLRLARNGDGAMAEPALRQAFSLKSSDAEVATGLGEILLSRGEDEAAFQYLKAAVEHRPDYPLGRMALGRLYRRRGSDHNAAEQFEAVARNHWGFPDAWYELALCYLRMQQFARAHEAIGQALKEAPDEPRYLERRAAIQSNTGDVEGALDSLSRAAARAPRDARVQGSFAAMLLANQRGEADLQRADRAMQALSELRPDSPQLPYLRGRLAAYRNDWKSAVGHLEEARRLTPGREEVHFALSQVYPRVGRAADAKRSLATYREKQELRRQLNEVQIKLTLPGEHAPLYAQLSELQARLGDRRSALASMRRASELNPKEPRYQKRLKELEAAVPGAGPAQVP